MSLQTHLMPEESVLFRTSLHWILFVPPGLLIAIALWARPYVGVYADWAIVGASSILVGYALRRFTTQVWVTDQRIVAREGILSRKVDSIALSKIESLLIDQKLPGRVFGYGTLMIKGTGSAWEPLSTIAAPGTIRDHVYRQTYPSRASNRIDPLRATQPSAPLPRPQAGASAAQLADIRTRLALEQSERAEIERRVSRLERLFRDSLTEENP